MPEQTSFDRVRPRTGQPPARSEAGPSVDRQGKRALFSDVTAPAPTGSVTIRCSQCQETSSVSVSRALRLALPAIPAFIPGKGLRTHMKCPACGERAWQEVTV